MKIFMKKKIESTKLVVTGNENQKIDNATS